MSVVLANNATGKLSGAITAATTSISLQSGNGAAFPIPAAGEWFPMTLIKATGELEIVKCTSRSADTFTVVRAQEGTVGLSFNAGDRVSCRFTALAYAEKQNRITILDGLLKEATEAQFRDSIGAAPISSPSFTTQATTPLLITDRIKLLNSNRTVDVAKIAEMNGGFSFRNKIIDGRFDFWYEATTHSTSGYGSSTMWMNPLNGSTKVSSQQPLVAGVDLPAIDCPSARYFIRNIVTSIAGASNYVAMAHKIENVNTLAGKTATLSFYAKADSAKNISVWAYQNFGSGGSASVDGISNQLVSLTTTWKRYSVQITLPSISGKTIGTSSYMSIGFGFDIGSGLTQYTNSCGQQSGTFDIACVQLEEGSVMTPFEELPIEVSQMLVNRYFQQTVISTDLPISYNTSGMVETGIIQRPAVMRATPAHSYSPATGITVKSVGGSAKVTSTSLGSPHNSASYFDLTAYVSSYTWSAGDFVNANFTLNADARL